MKSSDITEEATFKIIDGFLIPKRKKIKIKAFPVANKLNEFDREIIKNNIKTYSSTPVIPIKNQSQSAISLNDPANDQEMITLF